MPTAKSTKRTTKKPARKPAQRRTARSTHKQGFMTLQPTIQTFYWVILGALVIALAFWVLTLSVKIQRIYDQIDEQNALVETLQQKESANKKQKQQ